MRSNQEDHIKKSYLIEPHTGMALEILKDQILRVTDIDGKQVVDLVSYSQVNRKEYLSSSRSMDFNNKIYFSTGDVLYSDLSNPMWTIGDDKVGNHCFLFAPCDQRMFEITYGATEPHPNCFDNLSKNLAHYAIQPEQIFVPFNIFMNARINKNGEIDIQPPLSAAGDFIELRAEMDMIAGVSACSAYKSNDYSFGPVKLDLFSI